MLTKVLFCFSLFLKFQKYSMLGDTSLSSLCLNNSFYIYYILKCYGPYNRRLSLYGISLKLHFSRTLLWVSVIALPLLGATWVLALLDASEKHPLLTPCLSTAVLLHAGFCLGGYCFANSRVRQNLLRLVLLNKSFIKYQ